MKNIEQLKSILISFEVAKALRSKYHYTGDGVIQDIPKMGSGEMTREEYDLKYKVMKTEEELKKQDEERLSLFDNLLDQDYGCDWLYNLALEIKTISEEEIENERTTDGGLW